MSNLQLFTEPGGDGGGSGEGDGQSNVQENKIVF